MIMRPFKHRCLLLAVGTLSFLTPSLTQAQVPQLASLEATVIDRAEGTSSWIRARFVETDVDRLFGGLPSSVRVPVGQLSRRLTSVEGDEGRDLHSPAPVPRNLSTTMGHSTGLIREQCPVW